MKFTELILSERIRLINDRRDVNLLYDLFEKHFPESYEKIKPHLFLRGDFIKNRLFISSDSTEIISIIFNYLSRLGIKFESIGNFELRLNIHHFINKLI